MSMEELSNVCDEVSKAMSELTRNSEEISTAMNEQTETNEEIAKVVEDISNVADTNRLETEKTSDEIKTMLLKAAHLDDIVNMFTINANEDKKQKVLKPDDGVKLLNCWEYKQCGREAGGSKVHELGVCKASVDPEFNGTYTGKNGGRYCWKVPGTLCAGQVQGSAAAKMSNCLKCNFYKDVQEEVRKYANK